MATSTLGSGTLVLAGTTSGTTTVTATAVAGTTTLTLPAATDTLVGRATTDTLTNKTLTGAAMNGTVGATTPSTGAFTTLSATGDLSFSTVGSKVNFATTSSATVNYVGGSADGFSLEMVMQRGASQPLKYKQDYGVGHVWSAAGSDKMTLENGGNLGLGVTPDAWVNAKAIDIAAYGSVSADIATSAGITVGYNCYGISATSWKYKNTYNATRYTQEDGIHKWFNAASGTADTAISFTQAMTLDTSGNLLVGTTTADLSCKFVVSSAANGILGKCTASAASAPLVSWNTVTSGNNTFASFGTEGTYTERGIISYNRAAGLTSYATTSDYRAKDIYGPVVNSGALIDSTPVYMGKMKGATQERPMFIAHETPAYAHTGEKDAVDADGNPVYQQMDASSLVPVMWAEIQSLRKRLAALESA